MVDCHERAVVERGVGGFGPCWKLTGAGHAEKDSSVKALFLNHELDLVTTGGGEFDTDLVLGGGEVAVAVLDLEVDQVAGFDLILWSGCGA